MPAPVHNYATDSEQSTENFQTKMKTSLDFLLVLILCYLCRAQKHSIDYDILLEAVESGEEKAAAEGGEQELGLQSDIWAELQDLRDMVVEHRVELRHLKARVTAAESLVEELQMENDAQAIELAITQQKLIYLQQRLTVSELCIEELVKKQEVRKLAFSASLLASGEGNTGNPDTVQLIYRNAFTNIGNHYNPNTGYFTAPVRGVYYFRFTGYLAQSDEIMRLGLVKNGHLIVTAGDYHTTSTDPEDNACNGAVIQLEVGDLVSIQHVGKVWDDQYHRTTFSGFLLFPL